MAWIEFHQSLVTHHKLSTFADELGVKKPQAAGHLAFLWCWALDNARNGDLTHISFRAIADAAGWTKKPEAFVAAMRRAGFVCSGRCEHEATDETVILHDWQDYAGRLIDRRSANAERMKEARAKRTWDARAAHVQGLPTVPNQPDQPPPAPAPDRTGAAYRAVENLVGLLNPVVADAVDAMLTEGVQPEWIEEACKDAALNNKRNWRYAAAIIERWKREGFKSDTRKAKPDEQPAGTVVRDDFDWVAADQRREAAERAVASRRQAPVGGVSPASDAAGGARDQDELVSRAAV